MGHAWQTDFTLLISHFFSFCLPLQENTPSLNYWPLQGYRHGNLINDRTDRYIQIIHQYEDKSSVNTHCKCAFSMPVCTQCRTHVRPIVTCTWAFISKWAPCVVFVTFPSLCIKWNPDEGKLKVVPMKCWSSSFLVSECLQFGVVGC